MRSFILPFWSSVFAVLGRVSAFSLVRALSPWPITAGFVEVWVLGHLLLACGAAAAASLGAPEWLVGGLVFYGFLRVFEISVYQVNVLLFDEYRSRRRGQTYELESYRRMVILLLHNYFEIIAWFAATYLFFSDHFVFRLDQMRGTLLGGLYTSFIEMTTFGEPNVSPRSGTAAVIMLFQSVVGLFMTLLSLARFVGLIPTPRTKDRLEQEER